MQTYKYNFSRQKSAIRRRFSSSMKVSHINNGMPIIIASAVLAVILVCTSCGSGKQSLSYKTSEEAVNAYSAYLSDVRSKKGLTFDKLVAEVAKWCETRDSVVSCLRRDTMPTLHRDWNQSFHEIHDSLRKEFCRIVLAKPRTYKDVVMLKEVASPYMQDEDLQKAKADAQPLFASLDSTVIYSMAFPKLLERYRMFLTQVQKKGIHSKSDLLNFIREEDVFFRSFLSHLNETDKQDMQDIIQHTERCCLQVFRSADRKELSYRDALVYMTMRTNRRLVLNASQCINDVKNGKVKTPASAQAYIWMLVQPYTSIDGLGIAVLSDMDRKRIDKVADETPMVMERLCKILQMDKERTKELPALFMKIIVTTF